MDEKIKVYVVKYNSKNLQMRYDNPITGKRITRTTGTAKRRDAERVAAKWEAELREGRYHQTSRETWENFRLKYEKATIGGYLAHLKAALGYAVDWGYLPKLPELPKQQRVKRAKTMKGRPITTEEFERMLDAVDNLPKLIEPDGAGRWKFYLRGLWLSGLRLEESLHLYWNADDCTTGECLEVKLDGRRPLLVIPAALEKGNEDRLLPMAPEFAEFLELVPKSERHGHVFKFLNRRTGKLATVGKQWVSSVGVAIGKKAGVVVNNKTRKCASVHDLRRAFGQRWAAEVMPQILMQLMRHKDISTTMKYYVGYEAEATADVLWEARNGSGKDLGKEQPKTSWGTRI